MRSHYPVARYFSNGGVCPPPLHVSAWPACHEENAGCHPCGFTPSGLLEHLAQVMPQAASRSMRGTMLSFAFVVAHIGQAGMSARLHAEEASLQRRINSGPCVYCQSSYTTITWDLPRTSTFQSTTRCTGTSLVGTVSCHIHFACRRCRRACPPE